MSFTEAMRPVARAVAESAGVEVANAIDGSTVHRLADRDAIAFYVRLPTLKTRVEVAERELHYSARDAFDAVQDAVSEAAARLRGRVLREILDGRRAIDWTADVAEAGAADPGETRHERAERIAVRLAEESEKLMRLAAELRGAA